MKRIALCSLLVLLCVSTALAQPAPSHPRTDHARFTGITLTDTALTNAIAFTKLLGYVQHFHPSDQALGISWDDFAIQGMSQVLNASGPSELASTLQSIFTPIAPTVRVYPAGQRPPLPAELQPAKTSGLSVVEWYHYGAPGNAPVYINERLTQPLVNGALPQNIPDPHLNLNFAQVAGGIPADWYTGSTAVAPNSYQFSMDAAYPYGGLSSLCIQYSGNSTSEYAYAVQTVSTNAFQGTTVQLTGAMRTEKVDGYTDLLMRADGPNGSVFQDLGGAVPHGTTGWQTFSVALDVPADATTITFGLTFTGSGTAWFGGLSLSGIGAPYPVLNPASPYTADLGGGVWCFVPLALYSNSQGTLPAAPAAKIPSAKPYSVSDEATRLAGVALIWNAIQHFQPYFDVVADDWPGALRQALTSAAAAADEPSYFNTLRTLTAALRDGHASFLYHVNGETDYCPPIVWSWIEGQLVVTYVAADQGQQIAPGDVVVSIDGVPAAQAMAQAESLASGATRQWIRYWATTTLIGAGDYYSGITLVLNSKGQQRTITMTRATPAGSMTTLTEPRPDPVAQLATGIMYVDLTRVTDAGFDAAINQLAGARGIVFDMRGYPSIDWNRIFSHLTQQTLKSERFLIPINVAPDQTQRYFDETGDWSIAPATPFFPGKAVFLTDGRAISQAEVDMGIVENYGLGEIVGGPTAGTNGNITSYTVIGTYGFYFTGMKVLKQDGSQHHGVGIQPTVPVMRTIAAVAAGTDEVLERGLQLVQNPGSRPLGPWVASTADGLPDTASPGSLISITASPMVLGLPDSGLSGASVDFDGHAAFTIAGPDSILTVLPAAVAGQTYSQMNVRQNGRTVFSYGVQVTPAAPALFSADNTGRGPGLIANADGTLNSAENPAAAGSTITLMATGLGLPSPVPVSVMIGGQDAQAEPATSVMPDASASLFRVQATIPASTPPGQASVFVLAGGVASQGGLLVNVR